MIKWILSSSVLIGVIIGLRYLFRGKISARLQYALWALVLVRLLMPTGMFQSLMSVEKVIDLFQSAPIVSEAVSDMQTPGINYDDAYDQAEEIFMPDKAPGEKPTPEINIKLAQHANLLTQLSTPSFVIESVLRLIWYIGIATVAITFIVSNIKFSLDLRRNRQLLKDEKPPIYTCEGLETPCLFGLFRPAIYLTPEDAEDEKRSNHILAHERTHLKHWDHIWSILRCVCLAIHWYNPLVWIAAILSRQDAELACDEATINKLGEDQRIPYGETLVQTTCTAKPTTGILGIATTMTGSGESIKQRIIRIAKKPKFNVYALIAVILAGALSIGCTWFGAVPSDNDMVTIYLIDQVLETDYRGNGSKEYTICKYDENHNLISAAGSTYRYDDQNRITRTNGVSYSYNDLGQIIYCDKASDYYNYTYNDKGQLIHCEGQRDRAPYTADYSYDSNGTLRDSKIESDNGKTVYIKTYNADGNLLKFESYDKGQLRDTSEYTYDIFGRATSHKAMMTFIHPTTAKAYASTTYSYDLAGNLIKAVYTNDFSAVKDPTIIGTADHTVYYYYDLSGNLLSISEDYGEGAKTRQIFTYDLFGRISRHQVINLWDYHYAYDENGNILSETRYSNKGEVEAISTFSYIPVQVSRKDAERLLAQQESIYSFLFKSYPPNPMPEGERFYP